MAAADYPIDFSKTYSLKEISALAERLPMPVGRKYTLNFAVTKETILNADVLTSLFDKEKFIVKITPIHQTKAALSNQFDVTPRRCFVQRTFWQIPCTRGL